MGRSAEKKQCGNSGMWYVMDVDFLYQMDSWACSCRCVHMMTYKVQGYIL